MKEQDKSLQMLAAIHKDNEAEINGRKYNYLKTTHKDRLKVFAYFSKVQGQIAQGDFSFLDSLDWDKMEAKLFDIITFEGMELKKLPMHWDNYEEDYLMLVTTSLGVISYPLLKGSLTS